MRRIQRACTTCGRQIEFKLDALGVYRPVDPEFHLVRQAPEGESYLDLPLGTGFRGQSIRAGNPLELCVTELGGDPLLRVGRPLHRCRP